MLGFLRRGQRWLTAAIVMGVGGVFVFFMGFQGSYQGSVLGGTLVRVGSYAFSVREFEQVRAEREQAIKSQVGDAYDADQFRDTLDQLAARALVERAVLALEASSMGLVVSKQEIERVILDTGAFRGEDGRFDRAEFADWVEYSYGNETHFMRDQEMRLLAGKMFRLVRSAAAVSDGEARASVRQRLEEVRIGFTVFETEAAPEGFEISEADLLAFHEGREAEGRALFVERTDEYDIPEQVRARHILFQIESGTGEAEEAAALAAIARLEAGEAFEDLARELSSDEGSKPQGGDLGFFGRGRMVAPFEEAAFSLEPGATSAPVKSPFGYHVIRVEERKDAVQYGYEDVRDDLAREILGREAGELAARELAQTVAAAVEAGGDLETATRDASLTMSRSGMLRRRPDGFVPGLGAAQELMATAFDLEPGESSSRIFELPDKLVLVQVLERTEPSDQAVEDAVGAEREQLLQTKQVAQVDAWISSRRDALTDSGELFVDLSAIQN